jgi:ATP-dependent RNA helicase DeaD
LLVSEGCFFYLLTGEIMDLLFKDFGLDVQYLQAVDRLGFHQPTPIQQSAIPLLLEGMDVLGQAQTGTGKTAAFILPILQHTQPGIGYIQALILAPTRELTMQIAQEAKRIAQFSAIRIATIYGGQSYSIQIRELKNGADIVVATTGRLMDLIRKGVIDLKQVRYLVLDEADEMLEMGFVEDIEEILKHLPNVEQKALFSATMPKAVRSLAEKYLVDPQEIMINPSNRTLEEIDQRCYFVREDNKFSALLKILEMDMVQSALVFVRTKRRAQELADDLAALGYSARAMHGDLNQKQRESVLLSFRKRQIMMMVATDVAARGLDIKDVSHVINYDMPADPQDYIHRIGRTGRAGCRGSAISFLTKKESGKLHQIESFSHQKIQECPVPSRGDILAKRDESFIQKLVEQLNLGDLERERALVMQLMNMDYAPLDLAAAAFHLVRSIENPLPEENHKSVQSSQPEASYRNDSPQEFKRASKKRGQSSLKKHNDDFHVHEQEKGMVCLKMNLGKKQGLRPGDVVGTITGELGVSGKTIGKIHIFNDHTLLDVSEKHVQNILNNSNGQYKVNGVPVRLTRAV